MSLWFFSEGFCNVVLLLDTFVLGIDLYLYTVFSVSVLWVDFDLSNYLTLLFLLLLGVFTVLLDAYDLSVLLTLSIFLFDKIEGVMASSKILGFVLLFLSTISVFPYLKTVAVVLNNACLVSFKSPLVFQNFSLGVSYSLGDEPMLLYDMVLMIDMSHPVNSRISSRF